MKLKLLAGGLQYNVYDLKNGRVLKKPKTKSERIALLKKWQDKKEFTVREIKKIKEEADMASELTSRLSETMEERLWKVDIELFGNPKFVKKSIYTQDKVITLGDFLLRYNLKQGRRILRGYAKSVAKAWRYGFGENVFNFSINSGVNKKGRVIFIDISEFELNKNRVKRIIAQKRWLKSWSYKNLSDSRLKNYYQVIINKELTLKKLDENWKMDL